MKKIALIVAGGQGERMNSKTPKQFLLLNGIPVLMHTMKKFSHLDETILVLSKDKFNYWKSLCKKFNFFQKHSLVAGGANRFGSVKNGLINIKENTIVAIHDGVRPFVSKNLIDSLISKVSKKKGIIPILPITDSIRKINPPFSKNLSRTDLYKIQTPQCFQSNEIKEAYMQNYSEKFTDDSSVFESHGGEIMTINGEEKNLKITSKTDLKIAEILN